MDMRTTREDSASETERKRDLMSVIGDTGTVFQREQQQVAAWDHLSELRQQLYGAATWQMLAAADLHPGDWPLGWWDQRDASWQPTFPRRRCRWPLSEPSRKV